MPESPTPGATKRWLTSGFSLGAHRASGSLGDVLEALDVRVRAERSESLDRAVDDLWVGLLEDIVVEAEPLHLTGAVVLDDDVGLADQLEEYLPAPVVLQVESEAALVGVEYDEVEAVHVIAGGLLAAGAVARDWLLDLDYVGSEERE